MPRLLLGATAPGQLGSRDLVVGASLLRRRSSRRPETRGPAEVIVAPTPLALQCSLADFWLLNHA